MSNRTQGHNGSEGIERVQRTQSLRPRRSVVAGSLSLLVGGVIFSVAALPAMANVSVPVTTTAVATTVPVTKAASAAKVAKAAHIVRIAHVAKAVPTPVRTRSTKHVAKAKVVVATHTPVAKHVPVTTTAVATTVPVTKAASAAKVAKAAHIVRIAHVAKAVPTPVRTRSTKHVAKAKVVVATHTPVAKHVPVKKHVVSFSNAVPAVNVTPNPNIVVSGTSTFVAGAWTNSNPCIVGSATGISWPNYTDSPACNAFVLQAINNARAQEGVKPMVLPSNWNTLTTAEQLFVVADLERVDRGLPPYVGINAALSANAMHAALTNSDPTLAAGFVVAKDAQGYPAMGGAWSGGYSVLAADYFWMYADGWGGSSAKTSNIACTSPRAAGCWAHRLELLGSDPGFNPGVGLSTTNAQMGVGFAMVKGAASYVDLIEVPSGAVPAMSFTWAANVAPYLG